MFDSEKVCDQIRQAVQGLAQELAQALLECCVQQKFGVLSDNPKKQQCAPIFRKKHRSPPEKKKHRLSLTNFELENRLRSFFQQYPTNGYSMADILRILQEEGVYSNRFQVYNILGRRMIPQGEIAYCPKRRQYSSTNL